MTRTQVVVLFPFEEIGNKLGIPENTVKNHLKNSLAKLHLNNRVRADTYALQEELLVQGNPDE